MVELAEYLVEWQVLIHVTYCYFACKDSLYFGKLQKNALFFVFQKINMYICGAKPLILFIYENLFTHTTFSYYAYNKLY